MSNFCIVCREPVVAGSRLCKKHRAQAALFSTSIVEDKPEPADPHEHPTVRRSRESMDDALDGTASGGSEKPPQEWGHSDVSLYLELQFSELRRWARDDLDTDTKWPKLVVYCLRGRMLTRRFYGRLPRPKGEKPPQAGFTLDDIALKAALEDGGILRATLAEQIFEHRDDLISRDTETLSLSFLTHENAVELTTQARGQGDHCVARFVLESGKVTRAES